MSRGSGGPSRVIPGPGQYAAQDAQRRAQQAAAVVAHKDEAGPPAYVQVWKSYDSTPCGVCRGKGVLLDRSTGTETGPCASCKGTGYLWPHQSLWRWRAVADDGATLDQTPKGAGFDTLGALLKYVASEYKGIEVQGIGWDEPEAEGLDWPGKAAQQPWLSS